MTDLVVLSFDTVADARSFWRHGRDRAARRFVAHTDAALVSRGPDGTVQVVTAARHRGSTAATVQTNWATLVSVLFIVPVVHAAGGVLRRPRDAGLADDLVRRTAGLLAPGTGAVLALVQTGRSERVEMVARRFGARVLRVAMTPAEERRLVRALALTPP